ncbi:MAG TPA: hypothetical protein V6C76_08650 [Drouetiella sp.]
MTRECDAFRHHAAEQTSGLTWNQVHSEETYERTSHNFGRQLSAGISLDLGGAMLNIGTGGRYRDYASYGYGYNRGSDYGYPQSYGSYNPGRSYSYGDYGYGYNGYANNGYYNNSYSDGRYYQAQQQYPSYASGGYDYNQNYAQPNYYPSQNYGYGGYNRYDSGYQYNTSDSDWNYQYSSTPRYSSNYGSRYSSYNAGGYDTGAGNYDDDCNYGNPFDLSSRRNSYSGYRGGDYAYNNYSGDDDRYEYNVGPYQQRQNYPQSQYYGDYGYQNDYRQQGYYNNNEDWQRMRSTLQSMLGSAPSEYNRNVPDDLGCATVVSAALRRSYGLRINDTNVNGLENSLRQNGFEAIPIQDAQPGDCIIGHRRNGQHGHAAIYVGDGKIVNNSSAKGRVVVASLNNFASSSYESVVAYRRV